MANFTDPIKAAFGRYLGGFYAQVIGDTPAVAEFAQRGFSRSAVWAPGRMVDQVEEMLAAWRKNDTELHAKPNPYLPVMIAAMSNDFTPAPTEYVRPLADAAYVRLPGDQKGRVFKLRVAVAAVKTQVAICAQDPGSAKSIAMQLDLWCKESRNRRFYARFPLAGFDEPWPVTLEMPELMAVPTPQDVKNLTVLTVDIDMHATVPMLMHPAQGAADADGKGTGTEADPDGYLVVTEAQGFGHEGTPADTTPRTWVVSE